MPVPEQQRTEASLDVEVTPIDWRPHDHLPESREIIGPIMSARRSADMLDTPGRGNARESTSTGPSASAKEGD